MKMFVKFIRLFIFLVSLVKISLPGFVDDRLDDLLVTVDETLAVSRRDLTNALTSMNHTAYESEIRGWLFLNVIGESFEKHIDELKNKAAIANVEIDECLREDEIALIEMPRLFEQEVVRCLKKHKFRIFAHVKRTYQKITTKRGVISSFKKGIEECETSELCLEKLANKVEKDVPTINEEISKQTQEVLNRIETISNSEFKKCVDGLVRRCRTKGKQLLDSITTCVFGKLNR